MFESTLVPSSHAKPLNFCSSKAGSIEVPIDEYDTFSGESLLHKQANVLIYFVKLESIVKTHCIIA